MLRAEVLEASLCPRKGTWCFFGPDSSLSLVWCSFKRQDCFECSALVTLVVSLCGKTV